MLIEDENKNMITHFASDPELDLLQMFNKQSQREFYTNEDFAYLEKEDNYSQSESSEHRLVVDS